MQHAPLRLAVRYCLGRLSHRPLSSSPSFSYATRASFDSWPHSSSKSIWLLSLAAVGCGGWYWQQSRPSSTRQLSYSYFTPLAISSIERLNAETSMLTLELPQRLKPDPATYPEPADTPLQALYVQQPELQIQRAYTPLDVECFSQDGPAASHIRLLVKRYKDGEVSSYIHQLKAGDELFVRGPVRTCTLPDCDRLIFVRYGKTGARTFLTLRRLQAEQA